MASGRWSAVLLGGLCVALAAGCGDETAATDSLPPIAFTANQGGEESVVLIDEQGRHRRRVGRAMGSPAWSADGALLAVARQRGDDTDIALVRPDGSVESVVTRGAGRDDHPAFSPDSEWVAFSRTTVRGEGRPQAAIHVVRRDGTGLRRVTSVEALDAEPAWSPDGRRLAFTRARMGEDGLSAQLRIVDVEGGRTRRLAEGRAAAWSPDGRRIAYATGGDRFGETCFEECRPNGEIHVVGADGRGDQRLTRSRADDADPAWTSAEQIIFSSDPPERSDLGRELYTMSAEGRCATRLTNASSWSGEPAWRPGAQAEAACEADAIAPGAQEGFVDVDLSPARAFTSYPLLWLGPTHRGRMLSDARRFQEGFADRFIFIYDDCASTEPCAPAVQVDNRALCWWTQGPAPVALRRVGSERGAPVFVSGRETDENAQAEVHTGEAAVSVTAATDDQLRRALAALRPLDGKVGSLESPARSCE